MSISLAKRRKRLLVLADYLEHEVKLRLDRARFYLGDWGRTDVGDIPDKIDDTSACGFEGCAVGWAYYCKPLVKAGIRRHVYPIRWGLVAYQRELAEFFGLEFEGEYRNGADNDCEFTYCFMPDAYCTVPRGKRGINTVVRRLREVAAREVGKP